MWGFGNIGTHTEQRLLHPSVLYAEAYTIGIARVVAVEHQVAKLPEAYTIGIARVVAVEHQVAKLPNVASSF